MQQVLQALRAQKHLGRRERPVLPASQESQTDLEHPVRQTGPNSLRSQESRMDQVSQERREVREVQEPAHSVSGSRLYPAQPEPRGYRTQSIPPEPQ